MRPSQPRSGLRRSDVALKPPRGAGVVARASPQASGGSNAAPNQMLFRRSAFDVAVVGAGAPAAAAAAAVQRSGLRTVWLDGAPLGMPQPSVFHRRPSHAPARLACADARLVALASEGLDAWRELGERFAGGGSGRRARGRSGGGSGSGGGAALLSEGGSLDLASSSSSSGAEILEACAEAAREAGVRGARLLAASEIEAALGATAGVGGGGGGSGLPLLSSALPSRSVSGLLVPFGGSLSFAAADEAAAADAASAGVERWGPRFALAGWRDTGGGSRFELRGERRDAAATAAGEEPAPLAEAERLVLVPPERGFEEFLEFFGISLPRRSEAGAGLVDVPWAPAGGGSKGSSDSNSKPSFSQLTPCVLCHGLADRAADPGAPRGGAFEKWLFVPSNSGGSFGGLVSLPPAFARSSLSASAVSEAALAAREAFLNSDDFDGQEKAAEEFLFSPFAEDAEAAAAAASTALRPLQGSPPPRFAFASRTLVTPDGAPLCGWAPLEVVAEEGAEGGEGEEGGRGGGSSGSSSSSGSNGSEEKQRERNGRGRTESRPASFGALGSQSGRVLVLSPAAGSAPSAASGPSHGLLSFPLVAGVAADLLSASSAVRGPLAAEDLSPTRKAAGLRCVELARDSWEGSK